MYVCMYARMHICRFAFLYLLACIHVYMYVCMHACMHVCRFAFLYLLLRRRVGCGLNNSTFLMVEQGGHHVHLTNAGTVSKMLKTWLQTTGADNVEKMK